MKAETLIFWPAVCLMNTTDSSVLQYVWSFFPKKQLFKHVFIKHVELSEELYYIDTCVLCPVLNQFLNIKNVFLLQRRILL